MANVPVPQINLTVKDFQTGVALRATTLMCLIGVCSKGDTNKVLTLTDSRDVPGVLGAGKLAQAVAHTLGAGGGPVYALRLNASTKGSVGAVTTDRADAPDGGSVSTGTLAVTGDPASAYDVIVKITQGGSVAGSDASYALSFDGGETYGLPIAVTASSVITGTGLSLAFDGDYNAGDTFSFSATAPTATTADLTAGVTAALDSSLGFNVLHCVGAATAAQAAAVQTLIEGAEARRRFVAAVLQARLPNDGENQDDYEAAITAAFAAFSSDQGRVTIAAGKCTYFDPASRGFVVGSPATPALARFSIIGLGVDPAAYDLGPLPGVTDVWPDANTRPALNDANFLTLRSYYGEAGYHVTNAVTRAPAGSDFTLLQDRHVINRMAESADRLNRPFLSRGFRVNSTTGFIDERDAQAGELYVKNGLFAEFVSPGIISDVSVSIRRDTNITADRTIYEDIRALLLASVKTVDITLAQRNPALDPASAAVEVGDAEGAAA